MTDPSGMSTTGQLEGLAALTGYCAVAVAVRARRAKIRQARKLRALRKVSGIGSRVGPTTSTDRSET